VTSPQASRFLRLRMLIERKTSRTFGTVSDAVVTPDGSP